MLVKRLTLILTLLFIGLLALAACQGDKDDDPSSASSDDRAALAQTALAIPTDTPRARETPTPLPDVERELARTTAQMETAVADGDIGQYMANIWQGDPLFMTEHRQWAEAWVKQPPIGFDITLSSISSPNENESLARMTIQWRGSNTDTEGNFGSSGSTFTARFYRESAGSTKWLFAGEAWQTINLYRSGSDWATIQIGEESEKIRLYYMPDYGPTPGTVTSANMMVEKLPGIYTIVSRELQFDPSEVVAIKLYQYPEALRTMVDITYPHVLDTWNQPGEALRLSQDPVLQLPPDDLVIAGQLAYSMLYQWAGDTTGNYPWWVLEGAAQLVAMKNFMTVPIRNNQLSEMAAIVAATDAQANLAPDVLQMQDWSIMTDRRDVPYLQRRAASLQAGSFVYFIDVTYGQDVRNTWIKSMANEKTLEDACQDVLGKSFEVLVANWLAWIATQA